MPRHQRCAGGQNRVKRKYTHHHGKLFWQVILNDAYRTITSDGPDMVELIVKSNSPTFKGTIYPKLTLKQAQVFVAWVEQLPIHQLPLAIRSLLQGWIPGPKTIEQWDNSFEQAKEIYRAMQGQHQFRDPQLV